VRQAWRVRPAAALLGVILTGTLVALLYLTQTLATTAVSVEISRLEGEIQRLERELQTYQVFVRNESSTSLVTGWAEDEGLAQLRPPIQVPVP
jgi:cell division protein FtsL